ncbi:2-oxoacid:acceptor oxidoreductase family protein [bacterium]|nr:2-oxoacid:acceptor oxidoreductase family protein [bacterium]
MHFEARFSAVGGQGIILAGTILADSAILEGKYAAGSPTYTAQVRGGPTKVDVIVDSEQILFPRTQEINFFLSLATNSYKMFCKGLADNAVVLVDPHLVDVPEGDKEKYQIFEVPVIELTAEHLGRLVYTSAVCLGTMIALTDVVKEETVREALKRRAPRGTEMYNMKALDVGINYVRDILKADVKV